MKFFKILLVSVHLVVIGLLLMNFLNAIIPPSKISWLNLLSLAFPGLISANFLLLILGFFVYRKTTVVLFIFSLLFFIPIKRWLNYHPQKEASEKILKILTFNVKNISPEKRQTIEEFLNKKDYDLIFLQEAGTVRPNLLLPYSYKDETLIAIYSRYKITNKEAIIRYSGEGSACAIFADVDVDGQKLRLVNIYLNPFMFKKEMLKPEENQDENELKLKNIYRKLISGFKKHEVALEKITKIIQESPCPVIVAGDFNAAPNSYEYYKISKNLKDAFVEAGSGSATSFHDYKFPLRIDYLFADEKLPAKSYKVDRSVHISDHFPVEVELHLKP